MTQYLHTPFKICDMQLTLPLYTKGDCIAFIRFAWYDYDRPRLEQYEIDNTKNLIVAAIKRIYPDAIEVIREIKTDRDLICLRNSVKPDSQPLTLMPEPIVVDPLACNLTDSTVPTINLRIYSCANLKDDFGNPDFEINRLSIPVNMNDRDWEGFREIANFANDKFLSVEQMMDSAMPGLRYPLKIDEIHEGDYFYTDLRTVSKVKRVEGHIVTMTNGFSDHYALLRPVQAFYLDIDSIQGTNGYTEILNESVNFFSSDNKCQYAHLFQHIARKYAKDIVVPINEPMLASDKVAYVSFDIQTQQFC